MTALVIAIPTHVFVAPQMAQSLARMCLLLGDGKDADTIGVRFFGNAVSTFGRNELVHWAIDRNATHVLWIDTDSVFPPLAAQILLRSGIPFIGANFALKDGSGQSSAWNIAGQRMTARESGIEEASTLGFGFTLTRMDVLEAVGDPWFKMIDSVRGGPADDDWFCQRARASGFPPYVHHGLSAECGHVGLHPFSLPRGIR